MEIESSSGGVCVSSWNLSFAAIQLEESLLADTKLPVMVRASFLAVCFAA